MPLEPRKPTAPGDDDEDDDVLDSLPELDGDDDAAGVLDADALAAEGLDDFDDDTLGLDAEVAGDIDTGDEIFSIEETSSDPLSDLPLEIDAPDEVDEEEETLLEDSEAEPALWDDELLSDEPPEGDDDRGEEGLEDGSFDAIAEEGLPDLGDAEDDEPFEDDAVLEIGPLPR